MSDRRWLHIAMVAIGALIGAWWALAMYGLVFRDNGARTGDPSWGGPKVIPE